MKHRERVIAEHQDLMEKIAKLQVFLEQNENTSEETWLLWSQYHAMCVYRDVLCMRIRSWGAK